MQGQIWFVKYIRLQKLISIQMGPCTPRETPCFSFTKQLSVITRHYSEKKLKINMPYYEIVLALKAEVSVPFDENEFL
jgi:hypothetical protein